MASSDTVIRGAKAGGAGVAGAMLLGPMFGPPAAGFAASQVLDARKAPYLEAGVAMALGSLFLGSGGGASSSGGVM